MPRKVSLPIIARLFVYVVSLSAISRGETVRFMLHLADSEYLCQYYLDIYFIIS